jgi:alkylhydroperoxidase family enzyme
MKSFKSSLVLSVALLATANTTVPSFAQVVSPASKGAADSKELLDQPRPTPTTRPEMKRLLEDMKTRKERIPLPPLSESEKESNDPRAQGYEGRLGKLFLPTTNGARGYLNFSGSPKRNPAFPQPTNRPVLEEDLALTLDYGFKTRLFWIASRVNNCQYCLGHQESKLLGVGMLEDAIAALDSDWSKFPIEEQAAFALARRLTLEPNLLSDEDITECKKHYSDLQVLEIVLSVAGNNAINRWKEGVGVPQSTSGGNFGTPNATDQHAHSYLTDTSAPYLTAISKTVYLSEPLHGADATQTVACKRPSGDGIVSKLQEAAKRTPRLPLVSNERAKELLGELSPVGATPNWMRLLLNFSIAGKRQVASLVSSETELQLSPLLRAQMSWVIALQNGAWYSLGEAQKRLQDLGQTKEQIDALANLGDVAGNDKLSHGDRALLIVAKNLAASPVVLTDRQVEQALKLSSAKDVVQTVHYTAMRSMFDRFTEAAALTSEN